MNINIESMTEYTKALEGPTKSKQANRLLHDFSYVPVEGMTAGCIVALMSYYHVTIRHLAGSMGVTQKRVRQVRNQGIELDLLAHPDRDVAEVSRDEVVRQAERRLLEQEIQRLDEAEQAASRRLPGPLPSRSPRTWRTRRRMMRRRRILLPGSASPRDVGLPGGLARR